MQSVRDARPTSTRRCACLRTRAESAGCSPCCDPLTAVTNHLFPSQNTNFRNLDDYVDKCVVGIQRRDRRLEATARDQRALLERDGGDPARPSVWVRMQAGCLRCLTSLMPISDIVGKMKADIVPVAPHAGAVHYHVQPRH